MHPNIERNREDQKLRNIDQENQEAQNTESGRPKVRIACRSLSSRSDTSALIWMTKEKRSAEKKKRGPIVPTVEKVSRGG